MTIGHSFLYIFSLFFNVFACVLPFSQGLTAKENKGTRITILSCATLVLYFLSVWLYYIFYNISVYWIIFFMVSLMLLASFFVLFQGRFLNILFIYISAFYVFVFISFLREALYCLLSPVAFVSAIVAKDSVSENILQIVITAATIICLYFGLRKKKDTFRDMSVEPWTIIIYLLSWIIMPCLSAFVVGKEQRVENGLINLAGACVSFMVIYFQCFVISFERKKRELEDSQKELELIEYTQKMSYQHYEEEKLRYEHISQKTHDLKKQLNLLLQTDAVKGSTEIENIKRSLSVFETRAKTGNASLDILIGEKAAFCNLNHINFACLIDGHEFDFLDIIDLYAIFGNALDNAIEYLMTIDETKRYLRIRQSKQGEFTLLTFENHIEGDIDYSKTSKGDGENHGFGIGSIIYSAEKYNGSVTISAKNDLFSVEIVFGRRSNQEQMTAN